jgi:hypothetical protein
MLPPAEWVSGGRQSRAKKHSDRPIRQPPICLCRFRQPVPIRQPRSANADPLVPARQRRSASASPSAPIRQCQSASADPPVPVRQRRSAGGSPPAPIRGCQPVSADPSAPIHQCRSASASPSAPIRRCQSASASLSAVNARLALRRSRRNPPRRAALFAHPTPPTCPPGRP